MFIATCNVAETIPGPLYDRMEVIHLDGYTEDEKVVIARDHLLARQVEKNGLQPDEVVVTDDALRAVVGDYTREAGVRNLERELGKVLRKVATKIAQESAGRGSSPANGQGQGPPSAVVVDGGDVREYLGRQKFFF